MEQALIGEQPEEGKIEASRGRTISRDVARPLADEHTNVVEGMDCAQPTQTRPIYVSTTIKLVANPAIPYVVKVPLPTAQLSEPQGWLAILLTATGRSILIVPLSLE